MPASTRDPANRTIKRFIDSHQNDWSLANRHNAIFHLNRISAWLEGRAMTLLHPDRDDLVDALNEYLRERGTEVKAASVLVQRRQLAAFYKWAGRPAADGLPRLGFNPMLEVPAPQVEPPPLGKVAEEWQYEALLATTKRRPVRNGNKPMNDRRDAAIIALLWDTGMRRSELCNIDFEHIDFDLERIHLPRTKGGRRAPQSRTVQLGGDAMELLDLYVEKVRGQGPGPLFLSSTHPGRRLDPQSVTLVLRRRAVLAGKTLGRPAEDIYTPAHSFRRALAINWLAEEGSESLLMDNHGWRTRKMIDTYTAAKRSELAAAEKLRIAAVRKARRTLKVV